MEIKLLDILIHIINIVILYFLLRLIIYKPVSKFMKERAGRIQKQMKDADEARTMAAEEKERFDNKISELDMSIDKILTENEAKAREAAAKIIEEAKKQADVILSDAREQARQEVKKTMESMQDQIADVAVEIAERILSREINAQDNYALMSEFFEQVRLQR